MTGTGAELSTKMEAPPCTDGKRHDSLTVRLEDLTTDKVRYLSCVDCGLLVYGVVTGRGIYGDDDLTRPLYVGDIGSYVKKGAK